jgi:putative GTP pyrophosphokinase
MISTPPGETPSRSKVDRAGKTLRTAHHGADSPLLATTEVDVMDARAVLVAWRRAHAYPMNKANMGLRSMIKTVGCGEVEVSQRLKRVPTIIDKLRREPTIRLSTMRDIGGARAVVQSIQEIRLLEARLRRNGKVDSVVDYITEPRSTGYRALHVIVKYDDRLVEIQLRTKVMHEWAYTVEKLSGRLQMDLKDGQGPSEVLEWFQTISEAMAIEEAGGQVDEQMMIRIAELRGLAVPWFTKGAP